jgi:hypothetical protein
MIELGLMPIIWRRGLGFGFESGPVVFDMGERDTRYEIRDA